MGFKPDLDDQR